MRLRLDSDRRGMARLMRLWHMDSAKESIDERVSAEPSMSIHLSVAHKGEILYMC
jgi:hypothetical protein